MNAMIALTLATSAWATSIDEVANPRTVDRWITDDADVLDPAAEARLETRISSLHDDLGVEIAVVTLDRVDRTPKEFATGLFNRWGIGDKEANNGLLVLLVMGERRLEMETGYGLEPVLPDGWLGTMQQQHMVPRFKESDYGAGLEAGLVAVDARLRDSPEEAREGTRGAIEVAGGPDLDSRALAMAGLGAAGTTGAIGGIGFGVMIRRRNRTCPTCQIPMPMLDEAEDDAHLDAGQQTEEAIGSVDYQVHVCPQCDHTRSFTKRRWFSGYSGCPQCGNRTRTSSSTTVVSATQHSGGLVEVREQCAHCSYHRRYTRATARLPTPSSSSGSSSSFGGGGGGSSFGGGSSGGGGAGSSW